MYLYIYGALWGPRVPIYGALWDPRVPGLMDPGLRVPGLRDRDLGSRGFGTRDLGSRDLWTRAREPRPSHSPLIARSSHSSLIPEFPAPLS